MLVEVRGQKAKGVEHSGFMWFLQRAQCAMSLHYSHQRGSLVLHDPSFSGTSDKVRFRNCIGFRNFFIWIPQLGFRN